jgi:hypothetical protein
MNTSNFDDLIDSLNQTSPTNTTTDAIYFNTINPIVSEVTLIFLLLYITGLAILKITTGSSESLLSLNKYELTLFKNQQSFQKNAIVGRRLFDNSTIIQHNLNALKESGFDDKALDHRKSSMVGKKRKSNK